MFVRKPTNTKLTDEDAKHIKYDVDRASFTAKDVAEEFGVSDHTIRQIWNEKTYRDI